MNRLHHLPILLYHHVGVRCEPQGHRRLWVSSDRFADQMAALERWGYRGLSLRDALATKLSLQAGLAGEAGPRPVALTFDDGYRNYYEEAYPVLRRHGFGSTVFVVAGLVGDRSRWDPGAETPLMDWPEVREIHRQGVEIGSHTVSHPRLTRLESEDARRELLASRQTLERELKAPVVSCAYPYGDCDSAVENLAREAGYSLACTIVRGNLHGPQSLLRLKRVPVDEFTSPSRLRRRLSPLYDCTSRLLRFSRRLRSR